MQREVARLVAGRRARSAPAEAQERRLRRPAGVEHATAARARLREERRVAFQRALQKNNRLVNNHNHNGPTNVI